MLQCSRTGHIRHVPAILWEQIGIGAFWGLLHNGNHLTTTFVYVDRQVGVYVGRILEGENPRNLAVTGGKLTWKSLRKNTVTR
jgi:hypothetical protein